MCALDRISLHDGWDERGHEESANRSKLTRRRILATQRLALQSTSDELGVHRSPFCGDVLRVRRTCKRTTRRPTLVSGRSSGRCRMPLTADATR